jgi:hypothetical protein
MREINTVSAAGVMEVPVSETRNHIPTLQINNLCSAACESANVCTATDGNKPAIPDGDGFNHRPGGIARQNVAIK